MLIDKSRLLLVNVQYGEEYKYIYNIYIYKYIYDIYIIYIYKYALYLFVLSPQTNVIKEAHVTRVILFKL